MNPFRLLGDLAHVAAKCILIWSIHWNKSAEGISFLTQAMYALVFVARYLDVALRFTSIYNTVFKVLYIISAFYVLGLMRWIYLRTPEGRMAWQAAGISLAAACLFSIVFNYRFNLTEVLWSFSIALESACVIPQLILLRETTVPTVITSHYLLALGSYRALYLLNWIWRYVSENVVDPIAVVCGIIQTALYLDFAWVYYSRQRVKLRGGLLVDSEDYKRGWIVRWLSGKDSQLLEPLCRDSIPTDEEDVLEGLISLPPDVELHAPADNSEAPPAPR
ncbi:ER lumen protein retaining receptor-domain-containing protein [Mycena alexandri]|uniref:ER lumen protein retaining receptor-domain-containing protein n=1 Tax=Mycena alexandri TaxID=1745969 RepID=A0AAD6SHM3_9AGAR|nr:ER lumen protein retaining receptor-domain-containing protein [Mycena alexandri]